MKFSKRIAATALFTLVALGGCQSSPQSAKSQKSATPTTSQKDAALLEHDAGLPGKAAVVLAENERLVPRGGPAIGLRPWGHVAPDIELRRDAKPSRLAKGAVLASSIGPAGKLSGRGYEHCQLSEDYLGFNLFVDGKALTRGRGLELKSSKNADSTRVDAAWNGLVYEGITCQEDGHPLLVHGAVGIANWNVYKQLYEPWRLRTHDRQGKPVPPEQRAAFIAPLAIFNFDIEGDGVLDTVFYVWVERADGVQTYEIGVLPDGKGPPNTIARITSSSAIPQYYSVDVARSGGQAWHFASQQCCGGTNYIRFGTCDGYCLAESKAETGFYDVIVTLSESSPASAQLRRR